MEIKKKILFLTIILAGLLTAKSDFALAYIIIPPEGGLQGLIVSDCLEVTNDPVPLSCCEYCPSLDLSGVEGAWMPYCSPYWGWFGSWWYQGDDCTAHHPERWGPEGCEYVFCKDYYCDHEHGWRWDPRAEGRWGPLCYPRLESRVRASYRCWCAYCGDGECEGGLYGPEDGSNCCTDCGVPRKGCEDRYTHYWYTCEDNDLVRHTEDCSGPIIEHCGCDGYEVKYYRKEPRCLVYEVWNPYSYWAGCASPTSCKCEKDCGAECERNSDCNDGNLDTIDKCEANCTCSYGAPTPTPGPTPTPTTPPACRVTPATNLTCAREQSNELTMTWKSGSGGDQQWFMLDTSEDKVKNDCVRGCLINDHTLWDDQSVYVFGQAQGIAPDTTYYWKVVEVDTTIPNCRADSEIASCVTPEECYAPGSKLLVKGPDDLALDERPDGSSKVFEGDTIEYYVMSTGKGQTIDFFQSFGDWMRHTQPNWWQYHRSTVTIPTSFAHYGGAFYVILKTQKRNSTIYFDDVTVEVKDPETGNFVPITTNSGFEQGNNGEIPTDWANNSYLADHNNFKTGPMDGINPKSGSAMLHVELGDEYGHHGSEVVQTFSEDLRGLTVRVSGWTYGKQSFGSGYNFAGIALGYWVVEGGDIEKISYGIDGEIKIYNVPIPIPPGPRRSARIPTQTFIGSGTHTITYYAEDSCDALESPKSFEFTLTAPPPLPCLNDLPASITFTPITQGDSGTERKSVFVYNSGGGRLDWSASESSSWFGISPSSESSTEFADGDTVWVTLTDTSNLLVDTYSKTITFLCTSSCQSSPSSCQSQVVTVNLTVNPVPTGSISGYVWEDTDTPDCSLSGDPKMEGRTVTATQTGDSNTYTDTTPADGSYALSNMEYGNYEVCVDRPSPASDWSKKCPSDTGNNCEVVTVDGDETLNFGLRRELTDAWFQVIDGDIHSEGDITNPVP